MTSSYLDAVTVELGKTVETLSVQQVNPFYVAFVFVFAIVAVAQTTTLFMLLISICSSTSLKTDASRSGGMTIPNIHATSGQYTENGNGTSTLNDQHDIDANVERDTNKTWGTSLTDSIAGGLSSAFYWLGVRVGGQPKTTILLCLVSVGEWRLIY